MGGTSGVIVLLLGCVALSFLLSGMETGVLSLSRFRLRRQMRAGLRRAQLLHRYLENPEDFLWTILVGNTLATFSAFTLIVWMLFEALQDRVGWFALGLGGAVFLFYMLCDLLPKMLFRQFPNRLCVILAVPFRFLHIALAPLVRGLTWISDTLLRFTGGSRFQGHLFSSPREVRLAIQESAQMLTSEERAMVNRVLDLQDLTVRSILVPMQRVIGVNANMAVKQVLELCRNQPLQRLPVWEGTGPSRHAVGVVSLSTVLYAEGLDGTEPISRFAKAPLIFREDVRLEEALRRMQRSRQRMAVVIGFDGRELGVASLRDILRSIFGEVTL
jgi:CBS domain containing-hemolysin-like protein